MAFFFSVLICFDRLDGFLDDFVCGFVCLFGAKRMVWASLRCIAPVMIKTGD